MSPTRCKIEDHRIRFVIRICGCKCHLSLNRTDGEPFVIRAERGVCDCPVSSDESDCFVVFPIMRIRCIVHVHFEVLSTTKVEVAVIRELPRIASLVKMYDLFWFG